MSKVYEAVMRAGRGRDAGQAEAGGGLRDRLLSWMPGRRTKEVAADPIPVVPEVDINLEQLSSRVEASIALQERISSIQVTVDALDDLISGFLSDAGAIEPAPNPAYHSGDSIDHRPD